MSDGWDRMEESRGLGDKFIKLKDGGSVEGVFVGQPYTFYQTFKDKNEYQSWSEGRSFKFRLNFALKGDAGWEIKIFQGGSTIRDQIIDAKAEYGLRCVYKIKRTGSGKDDTRYSVLFKRQLSEEESKEIVGLEPLKLTMGRSRNDVSEELPPPPSDDDFIPKNDDGSDAIPF
jgi:hypothetical protein